MARSTNEDFLAVRWKMLTLIRAIKEKLSAKDFDLLVEFVENNESGVAIDSLNSLIEEGRCEASPSELRELQKLTAILNGDVREEGAT